MKKLLFYSLYFLLFCFTTKGQNPHAQVLNEGWQFRQYNLGEWLPATIPGTVHTDLMANDKIEDPFYRNNEQTMQWIDKINWEYALDFEANSNILAHENQQLTFYGLDTWCDVFLNEEKILYAHNMFRTWKVDVKGKLIAGKNRLRIVFYSPITKGLEEMEKYGLVLPASNDYSQYGGMGNIRVSVFSRKAPYHFGWDWGPRLVPSGIWRPIVLEAWNNIKIKDVYIKQPSITKNLAQLDAEISFLSSTNLEVKAEIYHNKKKLAEKNFSIQTGNNTVNLPFSIKNPRLWWSNGLGKAELYNFEIVLKQDNQKIASHNIQTGLRSLKLVRKKDKAGESFEFELNGVPVFAKGANSIPNDIFLPRITPEDYEKMVLDAYHANMNMIRIWGGGIYEDDYFYELCDKYGIMVWQDFMFACAMYPGNKEFLENVKEEAIDNIIRLRNHPSIALWCGNNEIDAAWARWGWQKPYNEEEKQQIFKTYTDLFHELLPELVAQYTDGDDYWPSSPMSGSEINAHEIRASTHGDNHYWGVWHEKQLFREYENNIGRFISEHGFQSFPEFTTVTQYALPEDYNIESEVMAAHQRSGIGNLRIKEYMSWYYNVPEDFEQFLYMSQVLQAQAMKEAMLTHRRHMPYCMGSLVWQLNDCWPVASWSTTDYYHKWKAAHYALKEACKPVIISPKLSEEELEIWIVNDNLSKVNGTLVIEIKNFNGYSLDKLEQKFSVKDNSSEKVGTFSKSELLKQYNDKEIVAVISLQEGKKLLDKQIIYFREAKDLNLPVNPSISIEVVNKDNKYFIRASTDKLARNVMFYIPDTHLALSHNYFDLLPNQVYEIEILSPCIQKINNNYIEVMDEKGAEKKYPILTRFIQ